MLDEKLIKKICRGDMGMTAADIKKHEEEAEKRTTLLETYLIGENIVKEDDLYVAAAKQYKMPFVNLRECELKKELIKIIPPEVAQAHHLVAFSITANDLNIATTEPADVEIINFLGKATDKKIKMHFTSPRGLNECLQRFYSALNEEKNIESLEVLQEQVASGSMSRDDLKKAAQELPIVNIVTTILEQAVYANASDVHLEPAAQNVRVRYRVDGVLNTSMELPKALQDGVVARVKVLAKLRLDEHMLPQDGRFKIKLHDQELSFRVSITPVMNGEKVVMRILKEDSKPLSLEDLGLLPEARAIVERNIDKPHGMALVTGPTGSGKTTTLYSLLYILNKPDVNIMTIEDPIEYQIPGISQSQVNVKAGFTFANALRSFLRQDPDIMMVGEIRDQETAEIAIHSAMTGHLVLSTLHTNDAPTTLPRLIDMGIPGFLVSFTVNVIVAQRLVRKLCNECKKEYTPDAKMLKQIEHAYKAGKLHARRFFRPVGCNKCGQTGYRGRIGIYEVMEITDAIKNAINSQANAEELRKRALEQGMTTLMEDGLTKAKMGVTSIEEVFKATQD